MATDMCHVHNVFIRGMNSVYLQSPFVKSTSDISDLLFYTKTLLACINAHHDGDEKYLFPGLAEYTKNPDIMGVNQVQHAAFYGGMREFAEYCEKTSPAEYPNTTFKAMVDSFVVLAAFSATQGYPRADLCTPYGNSASTQPSKKC